MTKDEKLCRAAVLERSEGLCERCGKLGHTFHHRKNRSQGGQWSCFNIVFLCGDGTQGCHGWVTVNPRLAHDEGFHLPIWEDPRQIPILLHGVELVRFAHNGTTYDRTQQDMTDWTFEEK